LVNFAAPTPKITKTHRDVGVLGAYIKPVITQSTLQRMNIGAFLQHAMMTASFAVLPLIFKDYLKLDVTEHWKIYLPVLFVSVIFSLPMIIISEKFRKTKLFFIIAVTLILFSQVQLFLTDFTAFSLIFAFLIFFIGFNFLEAMQPSLVAKYSDVSTKGTAMGVYSTAQFLGIFVGGALGGYILQYWGMAGVFIFGIIVSILYLLIAFSLPKPDFFKSQLIKLNDNFLTDIEATTQQLLAISGIKQAAISAEEGVAYLKVDKLDFDQARLDDYLTRGQ